jgi:hypothetical protein
MLEKDNEELQKILETKDKEIRDLFYKTYFAVKTMLQCNSSVIHYGLNLQFQ